MIDMGKTAAELKAELKGIRGKYDAILARDQVTEADAEELRAMDGQMETLLAEYSARAQDEQRAASNRQAMAQIFAPTAAAQPTDDGKRGDAKPVAGSLGARFVNDPQFKAWLAAMTPNGQVISDNVSVKSPQLGFDNPALGAALVTGGSDTSAGAMIQPYRLPGLTPTERDEINILDLITRIPIDTDAFEYVQVTSETNNAAGVLEATATNNGAKPESAVALEVVSGVIETIAHWIPITRKAASDARQIMAYIDDFLRWGLQDKLADQVLNGNGTSPQLDGITSFAGTQVQAFDNDLLTTTRKARTLVRTVGKAQATAFLMNPTDWETIDLMQDNENRYYFGGPMRLGTPVLWGLPVVEDEREAVGTSWTGDFREVLLFDREQTNVFITDSHSDFFIRNILVILAELRAGVGLRRPKALVEIDLTA